MNSTHTAPHTPPRTPPPPDPRTEHDTTEQMPTTPPTTPTPATTRTDVATAKKGVAIAGYGHVAVATSHSSPATRPPAAWPALAAASPADHAAPWLRDTPDVAVTTATATAAATRHGHGHHPGGLAGPSGQVDGRRRGGDRSAAQSVIAAAMAAVMLTTVGLVMCGLGRWLDQLAATGGGLSAAFDTAALNMTAPHTTAPHMTASRAAFHTVSAVLGTHTDAVGSAGLLSSLRHGGDGAYLQQGGGAGGLQTVAQNATRVLLSLAQTFTVAVLTWGGLRMAWSRGNREEFQKGLFTFQAGAAGFLLAWLAPQFVGTLGQVVGRGGG